MKQYDKYQLAELINESYPSLSVNASTLEISVFNKTVYDELTLGAKQPQNIKSLYFGTLQFQLNPNSGFELIVNTTIGSRNRNHFLDIDTNTSVISNYTFVKYEDLLISYFECIDSNTYSGISFSGIKINW